MRQLERPQVAGIAKIARIVAVLALALVVSPPAQPQSVARVSAAADTSNTTVEPGFNSSQSAADLGDAAERGDGAAALWLFASGADIDQADAGGMTALHWAAHNADIGMTNLLLEAGAATEVRTRLGEYTPLHLAARAASAPVVAALLDAGADVAATSSAGGATPLHFGAASGVVELVDALIAAGADVNAREAARGQTPLMFAAARDRAAVIAALVAAGANVALTADHIDIVARDAADRADQRGEAVPPEPPTPATPTAPATPSPSAYILDAPPGTPTPTTPTPQLQRYQPNDEEPLSYADLVGAHGGLTALLHAAREGHTAAALALLEAGADINQVSAGDRTSALLIATINGHLDLVLTLLERGADPSIASDAGATPLFAVVNVQWAPKARYPQQHAYRQQRATYLDVMRALLDAGVDPNVRLNRHLWYMSYNFDLLSIDARGATPFWRAAYALDLDAMRLLVAYGADPGIPTAKPPQRFRREQDSVDDASGLPAVPVGGAGIYPIHAASGVGYGQGYAGNAHRHVPEAWLPVARYLVEELGADVNARDMNGYNAVHHAAARGDNQLILYLVEKGADVTAVSRRGQTTADMANGPVQRIQPFPETVALLERLGSGNNHNCVSC